MEYNFQTIEEKWRGRWEESGLYKVENGGKKPKFYILDMFPYPSGAGLHVGHPYGYIASDITARYKRMQGFNVLHPMGFDAFGLPAEQYALETGQHPAASTAKNIERFKGQLRNLGFCYDWSRQFRTCDEHYYRWTQSLFLKLFGSWYNNDKDRAEPIETLISRFETSGTRKVEAATDFKEEFSGEDWVSYDEKTRQQILLRYRLAYLADAIVNWCPALGTVLANDEVKEGVSERGGHPVERIRLKQWFLRITAYSERLLEGLEKVEFSPAMKEMQRNWIGRSEGASLHFALDGQEEKLEIFTTRPDTIFGATFMVLAPEHDLVERLTDAGHKAEVDQYLEYVRSRSDIERQAEKRVTGVFTGAYAIHPFTGEKIPIWIAEYVLIGYGTGAIMAVPADDERDFVFAEKYDLPVVEIIDRSKFPDSARGDKVGELINSDFLNGMDIQEAIYTALLKVEDDEIGTKMINYRMRDAGFSRQRYWGEPIPIVYRDDMPYAVDEAELPLLLPEVESFDPTGDPRSPLAKLEDWVQRPDGSRRETDTMPGYAGSSWYYLRFMDPANEERFVGKEAEKYWKRVDLYIGGAEHAVGHLLYARFWNMVLFDLEIVGEEEPFAKLINQGMIQGRSSIAYRVDGTHRFVTHGKKNEYETTELRVDVNLVKNDVLDMEGLRKWRKDFHDAEFITEDDGTYRCGFEFEKMSKRWHNVVNPDDVVRDHGADCLRMFEMFLGPLEQSKPWDTQSIDGVGKFLRRFWRLFYDEQGSALLTDEEANDEENKVLHQAIKKVAQDIERFSFNTGVSALMICVNGLTEHKCHKREVLQPLVQLLAPYAPFIAEELWEMLGQEGSVFDSKYPKHDEAILKEESFAYPISVNGKVRAKIELPLDARQGQVEKEILAHEAIQKWTEGKEVRKVIYVPGKIINVVV